MIINKPEIASIYNSYIQAENKKNVDARYVGNEQYFHASGAGMCRRKHWYDTNNAPVTDPPDMKSSRVMRLGTVVHDDMEKALIWHQNLEKSARQSIKTNKTTSSISSIRTEGEINLPEYNVRGFYDAVFVMETGEVYLYDFKTIRAWGYTRKFGLLKNRENNPHPYQELQVATYGLAIKKEYGRLDGLYLYYFNKDSAQCKELSVSLDYLERAAEYWEEVMEHSTNDSPPRVDDITSPYQKWECNYCRFQQHCDEGEAL
jgi:CRISPR/Cas system-associated exonuclease Cas4 (RecB family)|tara:strand:+ start:2250 stop:3029 length:780 start_codon:yes stop_codon:yes gene_type:complete